MMCALCAAELDHCHGTLIVHPNGDVECMEPDCTDLDAVRHEFTIDCLTVEGGCPCAVIPAEALLHAS
ncbi:hypothetical protein SAMN05421504_101873 [Amycolatopsis xylanica]|uniref:Uncharacterized protein n=1 Tax=Amycolatopsis xylanica TaxID=589385 RepID=A0A1H2UFP6_9PSEU|nr:hypothetical protein [Amycolatopsis xylanica]SDW54907.1 hypothetical protein SAMN05421504_101873 [Amycolatopsis xylanica]